MDKLDLKTHGQSPDVIAERVAQLRQLFPDVFTEGKVNFDALRLVLGEHVDDDAERYGLNWKGKSRARRVAQSPTSATLRPRKDESVNWESTRNIFIEGDNLEVLKVLQKSYHRKVGLVYVEPPYNTGSDIIYPGNNPETLDSYLKFASKAGLPIPANSKESGRYHTNWLNMMYPRLFLARNLLRDDGYFAASIDDTELKNLESLLDEIFGEENRLAVIVLDRSRKNDARFFSIGHEYIVIYARNKSMLEASDVRLREAKVGVEELRSLFDSLRVECRDNWTKVEQGIKQYYRTIPKSDPREPLKRFGKVDARGPYRTDGDISWPGDDEGPRYDVPHPITGRPCKVPSRGWVYATYERMKEEIDMGNVIFGDNEDKIPSVKRYLFETTGQVMGSVWSSYAQTTAQEFKRLFDGKKVCDNPKDPGDLRRVVEYLTRRNDIVVELFARSATTAHAVFMSNAESGGSRRFICVQLPEVLSEDEDTGKKARELCRILGVEPTVSSIARERVRRAAKSLDCGNGFDGGFRAFRLNRSNIKPWNVEAHGLEAALFAAIDNIEESSTQDDILYELLLKYGLDLATPVDERTIADRRVFVIGAGALVVCLDKHLDVDLAREIAELKKMLKPAIMRVVFKDSGFIDDVTKTNTVQVLKQAGVDDVRSL